MVPRSRSSNIPNNGLWSVTAVNFGQPSTNSLAWFKLHATAIASPSVGAYPVSGSVVNLEPANTNCQPEEQQFGASDIGQLQCFCKSKYPTPSLLQSHWMQVCLLVSNPSMPSLTVSMSLTFDSSKILW